jgi:hypothetical protein
MMIRTLRFRHPARDFFAKSQNPFGVSTKRVPYLVLDLRTTFSFALKSG